MNHVFPHSARPFCANRHKLKRTTGQPLKDSINSIRRYLRTLFRRGTQSYRPLFSSFSAKADQWVSVITIDSRIISRRWQLRWSLPRSFVGGRKFTNDDSEISRRKTPLIGGRIDRLIPQRQVNGYIWLTLHVNSREYTPLIRAEFIRHWCTTCAKQRSSHRNIRFSDVPANYLAKRS